MSSAGPFFAENWYRVADLKPRLAPGVTVRRRRFAGQPAYVVTDPITGKSHTLSPHAFAFVNGFDGRATLDQLWTALAEHLGNETPSQSDVMHVLSQMHGADLIATQLPPDVAEQSERRGKQDRQVLKQNLMGPMSFRVPIFDPDPLLRATLPLVRLLVGPLGVVLWLALMVFALSGAIQDQDAIRASLTDQILSAGNLALMASVYVPMKLLHEFGHGWVARRYGAAVHEFGIMFLIFMPVPYVDITSAGALPSKWQRIFVSAAGIMVETTLAALAYLAWRDAEPGLISALLFNVMLIGGVSTLLVNGNPLLRFDGYFILSDLLSLPNLANRANTWWAEHWQRYIFGARDVVPKDTTPYENAWFAVYAPAAFVYRIFISITIASFLVSSLFVLGVIFAVWSLTLSVGKPIAKAVWTLFTGPRLMRVRARAVGISAAMAATALGLLFVIPAPYATRTQGVIWLPAGSSVRSVEAGFVAHIMADTGAWVTAGTPIALLDNDVAEAERAVALARVSEFELRLAAAEITSPSEAALIRIELEAEQAQLNRAEERLADLTIRASTDGFWQPVRPDVDLIGAHIRRGQDLGHLLPEGPTRIRYTVGQDRADVARYHTKAVHIRLPSAPSVDQLGAEPRVVPGGAFALPSPVLGTTFGGQTPVDPQDPQALTALSRVFQFETTLSETPEILPWGGRVHIRLDHGTRPIGLQALDSLRRLFLRGLDV